MVRSFSCTPVLNSDIFLKEIFCNYRPERRNFLNSSFITFIISIKEHWIPFLENILILGKPRIYSSWTTLLIGYRNSYNSFWRVSENYVIKIVLYEFGLSLKNQRTHVSEFFYSRYLWPLKTLQILIFYFSIVGQFFRITVLPGCDTSFTAQAPNVQLAQLSKTCRFLEF